MFFQHQPRFAPAHLQIINSNILNNCDCFTFKNIYMYLTYPQCIQCIQEYMSIVLVLKICFLKMYISYKRGVHASFFGATSTNIKLTIQIYWTFYNCRNNVLQFGLKNLHNQIFFTFSFSLKKSPLLLTALTHWTATNTKIYEND